VLAAGGLFFINRDAGGSLRRVDALGGAPTLVAADVGARFALEAQHDHLVATSNDDRILAVPLAGGMPPPARGDCAISAAAPTALGLIPAALLAPSCWAAMLPGLGLNARLLRRASAFEPGK